MRFAIACSSRSSKKGKQDGLGLGLALSRQGILEHGGNIWIEPAAGCRFVIRLPLNRYPDGAPVKMLWA